MELFERIKTLCRIADAGGKSLAEEIGVNVHTFAGYLSQKRQNNLWPLLDKILAAHPELSRNWLYFGEGHMLMADDPDNEELQKTLDELQRARKRVLELEDMVNVLKSALAAKDEAIEAYKKTSPDTPVFGSVNTVARSSGIVAHSLPKGIK